jgi:hypothetical protein
MKTLRNLFHRNSTSGAGRFDRYYGRIIRSGEGYPTADEARQDLRNYDKNMMIMGWPR